MTEDRQSGDLDRWVAVLQEAILERQRALFSAKVLAEARQPHNMGIMLDADGHALLCGPCGDTMQIFLRVQDSRIEVAVFMTDGCGSTVACGSMLTRMAQGKSLEEAAAIEAADLIIALDGLPPEHVHCATLAVGTLQEAIADHLEKGRLGHA
jgi:nitrogen fixation NifU-like protein